MSIEILYETMKITKIHEIIRINDIYSDNSKKILENKLNHHQTAFAVRMNL